jgi:outer membrane autotransporter protein
MPNKNTHARRVPTARLATPAALPALLAAALLASLPTAPGRADVQTFTGDSPATAVNATVAGGTIAISGGDGSLALSNGQTLVISDSVTQSAVATLGGKSDITFRAEGDGWAMLNSAGGAYRLLDITPQPVTASATATLNLDRVIVANVAMNAMFVRVSTASFDLVVNGDFVFLGNISASHGGAINWQKAGNLTFTGTAIFDRNTAGGTNLGGALGSTAAGTGTITFENTALFFSNTAASGGAIFTHPGHSLIFKDAAEFKNNTASTGAGGAFYIQSNDTYLDMQRIRFEGDATFDGNRAVTQGGAVSTDDRVIMQFDSTTGTVTLTNNRAGNGHGGAVTSGEISFNGSLFTVKNNFGGTAATHVGGGLRAARLLDITGNYNISENQTMGSGGGVSTGSLLVNGGGTLSGNIASVNGGAVNATGNSTFEISGGAEFSGNTAGGLGGAIYVGGASRLTLNASTGDIVFSGNKQAATIDSSGVSSTSGTLTATGGTNNTVYFASSATLVLNTGSGMAVRFDDPIESAATRTVSVTKSGAGAAVFSDYHSNIVASTTVGQGEFRLSGGAIYGAANDQGRFVLKPGATLAGDGTVQAGAIEIETGARLLAADGGLLSIASAAAPTLGNSLVLGGSGTIAVGAASNLLSASLIDVGADEPAGARTLAIANDLSLENSAAIRLDLYAGNISDKLAALSGLAMQGRASINIGLVETGSFNLVSWETGGLTAAQLDLSFGSGAGQTARNDVQLGVDATAKTLYLTNIVSSLDMAWTGSEGDGIWQSSALESANWSNGGGASNGERYFRNGDLVSFGGAASGTITVAGPGVAVSGMTIEGAADYEFRGAGGITGNTTGVEGSLITATGKLTKKGTGKLVLANTGANSFSGGVEIKGGELAVTGGTRLDADITIDDQDGDGAKLSGVGTFGNMVVKNGGVLSIGTSAASSGTITVADLTLDNASLYFDLFADNSSDYLKVTGEALVQSGTIVIGIFTDGIFNLGNFAGIKDQLSVSTAGAARQSGTLYGEGAELFLKTIVDSSREMTWGGTAGAIWGTTNDAWGNDDGKEQFANGDRVIFGGDVAADAREIQVAGGGVQVADMRVDADGYVFTGSGGIVSGTQYISASGVDSGLSSESATGKLIKTGTGALKFENTGTNIFEGGIVFGSAGTAGGIIEFSSVDQIRAGTSGIEFVSSGTLQASADVSGTIESGIAIGDGATGGVTIAGGTLVLGGKLSSGGTFSTSGGGVLALTADSSQFTGVADVSGTLLLAGGKLGGRVNTRNGAVFGGAGEATGQHSVYIENGAGLQIGLAGGGNETLHVVNLIMENGSYMTGSGTLTGTGTVGHAASDLVTVQTGSAKTINLASNLAGEGVLIKDGDGTLQLSGQMNIGGMEIRNGLVSMMSGAPVTIQRTLLVGTNATLSGTGQLVAGTLTNRGVIRVGKAGGADEFGTLTVNGNYTNDGGTLRLAVGQVAGSGTGRYVQSDKFKVTGAGTGVTTVYFEHSPGLYRLPEGVTPPDDIVEGIAVNVMSAKTPGNWLVYGVQEWWFTPNAGGTGGIWETDVAPEVPPATGLDTASVLMSKASLGALSQRLAWNRVPASHHFIFWLNGLYRNDKLTSGLYDGAKTRTTGLQAGADWSHAGESAVLSFGIFADYAKTDMDQARKASSTMAEADGYGMYGTLKIGRWYVDAILRGADENYTISVPGRPDFETDGTSWTGSIETGMVFSDKTPWRIEPQLQLVFQHRNLADTQDYMERHYVLDSADSLETRAGIKVWRELKWGNAKIVPWLRGSYLYEFKGDNKVIVDGATFASDLKGSGLQIDAGLSIQTNERFAINGDFAWYNGGSLRSHMINIGCSYKW